jgi:hypothetical protein
MSRGPRTKGRAFYSRQERATWANAVLMSVLNAYRVVFGQTVIAVSYGGAVPTSDRRPSGESSRNSELVAFVRLFPQLLPDRPHTGAKMLDFPENFYYALLVHAENAPGLWREIRFGTYLGLDA